MKKRETANVTFKFEGRRKPVYTDVVIAAHAYCVRTTMLSLYTFENFLRFQTTR